MKTKQLFKYKDSGLIIMTALVFGGCSKLT